MARCTCDTSQLASTLDDLRTAENQKFPIEYCFEAVKRAMDLDVDITSKSRPFNKKEREDDKGEEDFDIQVKNAAMSKVIAFASLLEKGVTVDSGDCVPLGLNGVIKIGSANMYGGQAQKNLFESRDFLLPGEKIMLSANKTRSGSSYSTAYASGLAALVLYTLKAHDVLEEELISTDDPLAEQIPNDERSKRLMKAKTTEGMKAIFKVLSQKNVNDKIPEEGLFVRPYRTFGSDFQPGKDRTVKYLRRHVPELLPSSWSGFR